MKQWLVVCVFTTLGGTTTVLCDGYAPVTIVNQSPPRPLIVAPIFPTPGIGTVNEPRRNVWPQIK